MEKKMERIWYDPSHPAGFGGWSKLSAASGVSKSLTKSWLAKQNAYTLNKPMRRRFPTRRYLTSGINDLWQADLMEMIPYSKINSGYKYILVVIDVFSRFGRALPLKSKSADDVSHALSVMLKNDKPSNFQTDEGKEFYNSKVKALLKSKGINHYSVFSQYKAAVVERFNRTIRERLNKLFTKQGNKKWVSVLPAIVHSYNHSVHRSLGIAPVDVTIEREPDIWFKQNSYLKGKKVKYKINDYVRISKTKGPFLYNFNHNWSDEVFRIISISDGTPTQYGVKDIDDIPVKGKFYAEELQTIAEPKVFRIERIIRTKGTGIHKQYYVKWHGYKQPSWISQKDLIP